MAPPDPAEGSAPNAVPRASFSSAMRSSPSPSPCSSSTSTRPRTPGTWFRASPRSGRPYLAYAITFLLIGQVWANHHVMFDHIRVADRIVLFLNTLLLMDIAFLPFAASVLSGAFHAGHGQRTAVVFYGAALEAAAILFNSIWEYARHGDRLLHTIDTAGAKAISRRFRLALTWIATGTLLGGLLPVLGMVVIAAFIPFYWWPISGEIASAKPRRDGRRQVDPGK